MNVVTTVTLFLAGKKTQVYDLEKDKWEMFEQLWSLIEVADDWMRRCGDNMPDLMHQTTIGITITVPRQMPPSSIALQQMQLSHQRLTQPLEHGGPESKSACELSATSVASLEPAEKSKPSPPASTTAQP